MTDEISAEQLLARSHAYRAAGLVALADQLLADWSDLVTFGQAVNRDYAEKQA